MCVSTGIGHLSLKRKAALGMAENGGSLRRSCEFGSDMLWPPPLESDGQYTHTHIPFLYMCPTTALTLPLSFCLSLSVSLSLSLSFSPLSISFCLSLSISLCVCVENHSAPPDVTGYSSDSSHSRPHSERHIGTIARNTQKYGNAERMETGDGVPVSSRVSAKIQQLVNTLKMPRRPPLREFFVDDFEELLEGRSYQPINL